MRSSFGTYRYILRLLTKTKQTFAISKAKTLWKHPKITALKQLTLDYNLSTHHSGIITIFRRVDGKVLGRCEHSRLPDYSIRWRRDRSERGMWSIRAGVAPYSGREEDYSGEVNALRLGYTSSHTFAHIHFADSPASTLHKRN